MQKELGYTMNDILALTPQQFLIFLESLDADGTKEDKPETVSMKIDEAFPQFFTDPNATRKEKK